MKTIPEIAAERQRLLLRLDHKSQAIRQEIEAIKEQFAPAQLLESAIENITDSVQEQQLGFSLSKLALSILPIRWSRNPVLNTGIRLATPWLLDKIQALGEALGQYISWQGIRETIEDTIAGVRRAFTQT